MRLLIYSRVFRPLVGGQEIAVEQLATALAHRGWQVRVLTGTPHDGEDSFPFGVVRDLRPAALLTQLRWCDLFLHAGLSLRGLWPLLLMPRPWAVVHHSWYRREDGRLGWENRLKRCALRRAAVSIAVSRAVADHLDSPAVVIPNAYRDGIFRTLPGIERTRDLVFVGRLVAGKGVDTLLSALALLRASGLRPSLSVVGDGPLRPAWEALAADLQLGDQVAFLGARESEDLCRILNAHRILVLPSRAPETFGIAALEGIAAGCVVVGSAQGGLPEAIGPCGLTFPPGDDKALARTLEHLLSDAAALEALRQASPRHLLEHTSETFADRYTAVLAQATGSRPR